MCGHEDRDAVSYKVQHPDLIQIPQHNALSSRALGYCGGRCRWRFQHLPPNLLPTQTKDLEMLYDPYGQIAGLRSYLHTSEQISRGTGRSDMVFAAVLKTGGAFIVSHYTYKYFYHLLSSQPPRIRDKVQLVVAEPRIQDVFRMVRIGPIYFDHTWIADFLQRQLEDMGVDLASVIHRFPSPMEFVSNEQRFDHVSVDLFRQQYMLDPGSVPGICNNNPGQSTAPVHDSKSNEVIRPSVSPRKGRNLG